MKHFNNIPIVTILLFSYILTLYSIKTHASALTSEHEIYKGFINPPQEAKNQEYGGIGWTVILRKKESIKTYYG